MTRIVRLLIVLCPPNDRLSLVAIIPQPTDDEAGLLRLAWSDTEPIRRTWYEFHDQRASRRRHVDAGMYVEPEIAQHLPAQIRGLDNQVAR